MENKEMLAKDILAN